jgi:hypothetical protein
VKRLDISRCAFAAATLITVICLFLCVLNAPAGPAQKKPTVDGFGYSKAFDAALQQIGEITPEQFAARYPLPQPYLKEISIDPCTAKYFDQFELDTATLKPPHFGVQYFDYRLQPAELAVFKKQGFVVCERMGATNFAELYYRLFSRDLPVYVSSDAVLHAWHRSYDGIVSELEGQVFAPTLEHILTGMSEKLLEAKKEYGDGVLTTGYTDADFFLAVARSLLTGIPVPSVLGQDAKVSAVLGACDNLQMLEIPLFGRDRLMDFSQFKPRGHYEKRPVLQRYFRAMMWCGRVDFRIAGNPDESSPRELAGALVLHDLLRRSGHFQKWVELDQMLQTFVGRADSLTFGQVDAALRQAGMQTGLGVKTAESLTNLQQQIEKGSLGEQQIRGDMYVTPGGSQKLLLPRSFTVLGQRFALDSWALSKVVFDDISWKNQQVTRRIPSSLDVAFSVFNNRSVVPQLVSRIQDRNGRAYRDGYYYQHNLSAVHDVIDQQKPAAWDENIYSGWLVALRDLSEPMTNERFPETMRTEAWAMKTLNTQLASWAQLRHDTVLYVKQTFTAMASCTYPVGYVEPVPQFWLRLEKMATRAADLLQKVNYPNSFTEVQDLKVQNRQLVPVPRRVDVAGTTLQASHVKFLQDFAKQMSVLKSIAIKELNQQELAAEEVTFLKEVVQTEREGSGSTMYGGWYPKLFYSGKKDSGVRDAVVADVHTDPPDMLTPDPGCTLHQGVGDVDFMLIAIKSRDEWIVYGGGVLSHYEFDTPPAVRMTDSEWEKELNERKQPPRPAWTRSYLVTAPKNKKP